jgi:alpha-tubulin suppressor-like RCC1 family protein
MKMKRVSSFCGIIVLSLFAGCQADLAEQQIQTKKSHLIQDAVHQQGNEHFYWLPPMVKAPTPLAAFDPTLSPEVHICALDAQGHCLSGGMLFTMDTGPGSETIRVNAVDHYYIVNWHTDSRPAAATLDSLYRIFVTIDGKELGLADVKIVNNGKEAKNVNTDEYIPLVDGRTLPIKFYLEEGVLDDGFLPTLGAGFYHNCLVKADGSLSCWGYNNYSQASPPAGTDFLSVSAGGFHNCALKTDGSLACWGMDTYGQVSKRPLGNDFVAISAGYLHSCALKADGSLACWGYNYYGQSTPPAGADFAAVSAGEKHSCALKTDGSLVCWGRNEYGQSSPPMGTNFVAVEAGTFHSCALKSDGSLACWGYNAYGQSTPPGGTDFAAVSAGGVHSCALKTDGSLICWGANWYGQTKAPLGTGFVEISAGGYHSCALKSDESILCWGANGYGQVTPPSIP